MSVTVKEIARTSKTLGEQPIKFPNGRIEVIVALYTIPAGEVLQVHRHRYPRYGYVLQGELTVTNHVTGASHCLREGQFAIEAINVWHSGQNTGQTRIKMLVIDQRPRGEDNIEFQAS
jgi:quercetin dioxygenase-like cupin family protein